MQTTTNWNDLKILLALYRGGSLAAAANLLAVNETTVSRRLRILENRFGGCLVTQPAGRGPYKLTAFGAMIVRRAEQVERDIHLMENESSSQVVQAKDVIRLSAVPFIIHHLLLPNVKTLTKSNPSLALEFLPQPENVDVVARDTDIALRFARPKAGGLKVRAKKLGDIAFAAVSLDVPERSREEISESAAWITYAASQTLLPQTRWLSEVAYRSGEVAAATRVADIETALQAVKCGLGQTLLPRVCLHTDPKLVERSTKADWPKVPTREVWMLSNADDADRAGLAIVKEWLMTIHWQ